MRKIKLLGAALLLLNTYSISLAQKQTPVPLVRCATDEAIQQSFRDHPEFKAEFNRKNVQQIVPTNNATGRANALTGPVIIPVIVHIVLPNPTVITEEQVDYFLNRLNLDYSGLNPDSTNGTAFYPVRGHSLLRFTRARRTPGGQLTNGIERRVGNTIITTTTYQNIKHASAGGLDPWDVTQYYNLWVGDGISGGLLGIAPAIGVGGQTETTASTVGIDGVCVDWHSFANSCFSYTGYNMSRTAVHEIGHNFGLYHTFQAGAATGGTCVAGNDFAQPTPPGQTLPVTLVGATGDDTPALSTATTNCPTGTVASNCASVPNPPGKMYQNYMDYTLDACYSMFTKNQVARMEYMLETYRPGYLTTQGAVPPTNFPALDAAISATISPGEGEFNNSTCTIAPYIISCPGSFIPRVQILNAGSTTLTSVTVTVVLTGATTSTQISTTTLNNLATNRTAIVALPAVNLNAGITNMTFTITQVNGMADTYTANNTASTSATISQATLPFAQDFSGAAFPPANMTVFNPFYSTGDNTFITWSRSAVGNGNAGSAFIDNYDYNNAGQADELRTIPITLPTGLTSQDSVIITFDVAHKNYPLAPYDILNVLVSANCGTTFTSVYNKSGPTLATAGSSAAGYITPVATDWRKERIAIGGALITNGTIVIAFRNTNNYGNNIFIDNINIVRKYDRDISVSAIVSPTATVCANTFTPQATITNSGLQAIDSFRVGYILNGAAPISQKFVQRINPGASVTVSLSAATTTLTGNTIRIFSADPAALGIIGDQLPGNDTLTRNFITPIPIPLIQGFETAPFPPAGWNIVGGTAAYTWVRDNHGHNSSWSAKVDNYNYNAIGAAVSLQTPPLRTTGLDSVIVTFDVAHKNFTGSADVLQVLASGDCGVTFISYYNKSGATLATAGASANDYVNPQQGDWRTERVAIPFRALNSGSAIIRFQNTNNFGNNIFIDNINITGIYRRDAQLLSISQPVNVVCTPANTPNVIIRNVGTDTIKSFKVAYVLDNGTPVITSFPSVNILANTNQTVVLTAINAAVGIHTFRSYVFDLVTNSGSGDQLTQNDTLSKTFTVVSSVAAPLVEGFENVTFPPTGWAITNLDGATTWERDTIASRTGRASAYISNYNYLANGSRDELYTPQVTYTSVDSVFLNFDVAATTKVYPGSTELPLDTLEVLVTADCGTTLTSVYKKWGNTLQTVNDPNSPQTAQFIPSNSNQWRNEQINLSAYASRSPIQVVFRNIGNNGNNIFIDNVNLATKTLPAKLKEQGYLIYPVPFTTSFTIQHYVSPTELRSVGVYNSIGQLMYSRNYAAGTAASTIQVDMSRYGSGLYTVVLRYSNRTISQKIIKAK